MVERADKFKMATYRGDRWRFNVADVLISLFYGAGLTHKRTKRELRAPSYKGAPSKTGRK